MKYLSRPTAIAVYCDEQDQEFPLLEQEDKLTTVILSNEGGGEYVTLQQNGAKIVANLDELRMILAAAETLMCEQA